MTKQIHEFPSGEIIAGSHDLRPNAFLPVGKVSAFVLFLISLWAMTHRYKGLTGDAELYAMQALARIHPGLSTDLYLQNVSQDHFTIFSFLYAHVIGWFGLQNAALTLTILVTVWFLAASWALARNLTNRNVALLAVATLIITIGTYGGYSVFRYAEDWLTARSLAEALIVTALACHFAGAKRFGLTIAISALAVHPIMALPGILLLLCLWLPLRAAAIGAGSGILVAVCIACTALIDPKGAHLLTVVDVDWLEVIRERSQFLFLQLWTVDDWKINARPFICLTLTSLAVEDRRVRSLCFATMLVGATGLCIGLIAGLIGPVAILLQGQAWRWVWVTCFASVLLLTPTVVRVWGNDKCGPICAMLLILGWTFSVIDGTACVALALLLWLVRKRISARTSGYLRLAAAALAVIVVAWVLANSWTTIFAPSPESGRESLALARFRNVLGLGVSGVLLTVTFVYCLRASRSIVAVTLISTVLAAFSAVAIPGSIKQLEQQGTAAEINEFADWRKVIGPTDAVYVVPMHNSATFAWFTLERPTYLSVDQSAGVVFSRATALEVKRRSQVLLPMQNPDWRVLSKMNRVAAGKSSAESSDAYRPLTRQRLVSVCSDPVLRFVAAKESVGFDPMHHGHAGNWKDWNLYDCRHVRSEAP